MKRLLIFCFTLVVISSMMCCTAWAEQYDTTYPAKNIHKYWDFDDMDGMTGFAILPSEEIDDNGNTVAVFDSSNTKNVGINVGTSIKTLANGGRLVMETRVKIDSESVGARLYFMHSFVQIQGKDLSCAGKHININYGEWYDVKVILNYKSGYAEKFIVNGTEYDISSTQAPTDSNFWIWTEPLASGTRIAYLDYYKLYNMDDIRTDSISVGNGDVISTKTESITIIYSKECDITSAETAIKLEKDNGEFVNISLEYGSSKKEIIVNINDELEYGRNYILISDGVKSADRELVSDKEVFSFYTENQVLYTFNADDTNIYVKSNWYENRNVIFVICEYDDLGILINSQIKILDCVPHTENRIEIENVNNRKIYMFDEDLKHGYGVLR